MLANTDHQAASDPYVRWLGRRNRSALFWGGATWWFPYHRCLVPASLKPQPVDLAEPEGTNLLEASRALLLRHFSRTFDKPTSFWYLACDRYDFEAVSRNTRSKIRRAYKNCKVEKADPVWLANHGYKCYSSAYARYAGARPDSEALFQRKLFDSVGGPFDFWGVFAHTELVGLAKCVLGDDYVATVLLKFDPDYLSLYSAYGMWNTILENYVTNEGKLVTNGFRAFVHDTNVQDFLRSFGFRMIYCDLKVVYSRKLGLCVRALYPFRSRLGVIPDSWGGASVRAMLMQEEVRRSFLAKDTTPVRPFRWQRHRPGDL